MNFEFTWKKDTAKYSSGYILYLGKWKVCGAYFDSTTRKGDKNKWAASCTLPGMKSLIGHYYTEEEAKEVAERAAKHWLAGCQIIVI